MDAGWQTRLRIAAARSSLIDVPTAYDVFRERIDRLEAQRGWALNAFTHVRPPTITSRISKRHPITASAVYFWNWLRHPLVVWEP